MSVSKRRRFRGKGLRARDSADDVRAQPVDPHLYPFATLGPASGDRCRELDSDSGVALWYAREHGTHAVGFVLLRLAQLCRTTW